MQPKAGLMSLRYLDRKSVYSLASVAAALLVTSLMIVPGPAYSQFREVSGKYVNTDYKLEITLPPGYKGQEITGYGSQVAVMVQFLEDYAENGLKSNSMILSMADYSNTPTSESELKDPKQTTEKSNPGVKCDFIVENKKIKVSGLDAYEWLSECKGPDNYHIKSRLINVDAGNHRWISLIYVSDPASNYDKFAAEFDKSLQSLKIGGTASTAPSSIAKFTLSESGTVALDKVIEGFAKGKHKADVEISASYTFEGKTKKVSIDKSSLSGTLTIDKGTSSEIKKTLSIQNLSVSADLKSISFTAKVSGSKSDTVTGKLTFTSAVNYDKKTDQNAAAGKNQLQVKIGKATLDTKKTATGMVDFA